MLLVCNYRGRLVINPINLEIETELQLEDTYQLEENIQTVHNVYHNTYQMMNLR